MATVWLCVLVGIVSNVVAQDQTLTTQMLEIFRRLDRNEKLVSEMTQRIAGDERIITNLRKQNLELQRKVDIMWTFYSKHLNNETFTKSETTPLTGLLSQAGQGDTLAGQLSQAGQSNTMVDQLSQAGKGDIMVGKLSQAGQGDTMAGQLSQARHSDTMVGKLSQAGKGDTMVGQLSLAGQGDTMVGQLSLAGQGDTMVGKLSQAGQSSIIADQLSQAGQSDSMAGEQGHVEQGDTMTGQQDHTMADTLSEAGQSGTMKPSKRIGGNSFIPTSAFFAILGKGLVNPSEHFVIPFDRIITNVGGTFNSHGTGVFRCAFPGTYVFHWTICVHGHQMAFGVLVKNGSPISFVTSGTDEVEYSSGSGVAVIELDAGDDVLVRVQEPRYSADIVPTFTTFSGFLLT